MNVIEAPNIWQGTIHRTDDRNERGIFMAGGITGCPDWQAEVIDRTKDYVGTATWLNPRREDFPIGDPNAAEQQIKWERLHIDHADAMMFWFPKETLCPIVLFELGAALYGKDCPLFIGTDPEYQRRQDVIIQTSLIRPDVQVVDSIEELVDWALVYVQFDGRKPRRFRTT